MNTEELINLLENKENVYIDDSFIDYIKNLPEKQDSISFSESAIKEIKKIIKESNYENHYLRVGVSGGGCSGFNYELNFDEKFNDTDFLLKIKDFKVIVDRKSIIYLNGCNIDFVEDISKRGFIFNNPNATKTCGCNKSFSV